MSRKPVRGRESRRQDLSADEGGRREGEGAEKLEA